MFWRMTFTVNCKIIKKNNPFDRQFDRALTLLTRISSKPGLEALLLSLPAQNNETIRLAERASEERRPPH